MNVVEISSGKTSGAEERAGGTGTITRPPGPLGERPRRAPHRQAQNRQAPQRETPQQAPHRQAPQRQAPQRRQRGGTARPHVAAPRRARAAAPLTRSPLTRSGPSAAQRMPFILLLFGLLGGALICALVISTTLAEGSFRITSLQSQNSALARQRQELQEQVASAQSAGVIEQRAYQLGMRPAGELRFLNLKTGKTETDAGSGATALIHVPGYTP
ncbi:MAG: hypothetical protein JOY82_24635 [Streptosporangiaceae bacterium]|nr:hypothetical protein [Streptosporangiaceae bacterium]